MNLELPAPIVDTTGRPLCERCGKPVDPAGKDVFCQVIGWVQNRSGGGGHAVADRRDLGLYRHSGCHKHGGESLF